MSAGDQAAIADMVRLPPIVDVRVLDFTWAELEGGKAVRRQAYRIQVRRAGEIDWLPITVINVNGPPDQPIGDF